MISNSAAIRAGASAVVATFWLPAASLISPVDSAAWSASRGQPRLGKKHGAEFAGPDNVDPNGGAAMRPLLQKGIQVHPASGLLACLGKRLSFCLPTPKGKVKLDKCRAD
jgi:hypothetical protein